MRLPRHARLLFALLLAVAIAASLAIPAQATKPTAKVIEFYNAALKHYFIPAYGDEAAMLDAGIVVPGWGRTGITWNAWANASDSATAAPVCRFFGTPGVGPNSHFYTADDNECALVKQNPGWTFEAIAFFIEVPQNGACKPGTTPVYGSFYPGASVSESNHRFMTDTSRSTSTWRHPRCSKAWSCARRYLRRRCKPTQCGCSSSRPSAPTTRWCCV
jgi:hypothetical protein